jgi:hypothetical protein
VPGTGGYDGLNILEKRTPCASLWRHDQELAVVGYVRSQNQHVGTPELDMDRQVVRNAGCSKRMFKVSGE